MAMLFTVLCVLVLIASTADAAKRVALVIGNDTYQALPNLINARTDARGMAAKLKVLGFDVILKLDADHRSMVRALADFQGRASSAEVALVFYAGHGIQSKGVNFLIPSNAAIEVEVDLHSEGMDAGDFLHAMKNAGANLNIVIMDACRNNPLPTRRGVDARGLTVTAPPKGIKGTALVFSAAPGEQAQDGPEGGHGIFTGVLLEVLDRPGLKLEEVFKQTVDRVSRLTNNEQKPWINFSYSGDFVFNRAKAVAAADPDGGKLSRGNAAELLFWESIKDSKNWAVFRAYLDQYPQGSFASLALLKLDELEDRRVETIELPEITSPNSVQNLKITKQDEPVSLNTQDVDRVDISLFRAGNTIKNKYLNKLLATFYEEKSHYANRYEIHSIDSVRVYDRDGNTIRINVDYSFEGSESGQDSGIFWLRVDNENVVVTGFSDW
jgi:uncharacterized caspase-like protein